jgi:integrase
VNYSDFAGVISIMTSACGTYGRPCIGESFRNWGKTRKALRPVHIPKELADDLWLWRQECNKPVPEGFIFPSRSGGFIDPQNYRKKMRKLGKDLRLPKLTFQVIRRTIATLGQKKGTPKDIQSVLRHSRLATTTDVYMQEIPESVKATVAAINRELRLKPDGRAEAFWIFRPSGMRRVC